MRHFRTVLFSLLLGCVFGSHQGVVAQASLTNPMSSKLASTRSGLVVTVDQEGASKTPVLKVFQPNGSLLASRSVSSFASRCEGCRQVVTITENNENDADSFLVLFDNGMLWRGSVNRASATVTESGTPARLDGTKPHVDVAYNINSDLPLKGGAVFSEVGGACGNGTQPFLSWTKNRPIGWGEVPLNLRSYLGCNVSNLRIAQDHATGRLAVLGGSKVAIFQWSTASGTPVFERTLQLPVHSGYVYTDIALEYGVLLAAERRSAGGLSNLYLLSSTTGEVQSNRAVSEAFSVAISYVQGESAFAWYNGWSLDRAHRIGRFPMYAE